jgi:molecular chaperone IbpA
MNRLTLPTFPHTILGFDDLFSQVEREMNRGSESYNYPPHNIISYEDNKIEVEIAVAGFKQEELNVSTNRGELIVNGKKNIETSDEKESKSYEYLHRGLAYRNFELKFIIGDMIKVNDVVLEDGILNIKMEKIIPEEYKPKVLKINAK